MYGKVFESIYDGTLYGHWEAIVTMQQLIVLANADGVVDMTPHAIAARTSIPLDIILKGLGFLAEPDPYTRTPGEDGKRIVLLDDHRPWGWRLVNHGKYKRLRDMLQKREADRERQAEKRREIKDVASESQGVANVAHAYADTDANAKSKNTVGLKPDALRQLRKEAVAIIRFLNEKTGRNYQPVAANIEIVVARLKEGATPEQCRQVIAKKAREWKGDEKMDLYLRPATLFNRTKFAQYQGELGAK